MCITPNIMIKVYETNVVIPKKNIRKNKIFKISKKCYIFNKMFLISNKSS